MRGENNGNNTDTVISKETILNGSISSNSNIKVYGTVKGNITSDNNVIILGEVEVDITGKSVEILNGNVVGNIKSETMVKISDSSVLKGDIVCQSLELNGQVGGNALVQNTATLGDCAVIYGNIESQNLSIQEGAIVDGTIKVVKDNTHIGGVLAEDAI